MPFVADGHGQDGVFHGIGVAAGDGGRGPGFAHDLCGDALCDFGEAAAVDHEGEDGVALNVDEAGAGDEAGGID